MSTSTTNLGDVVVCGNICSQSGSVSVDDDLKLIGNIIFNTTPSNEDVLTFTGGKWQAAGTAWVGNATSNLEMDCYSINNVDTIRVGNVFGKSPINIHDDLNFTASGNAFISFPSNAPLGTPGIRIGSRSGGSLATSADGDWRNIAIGHRAQANGSYGSGCIAIGFRAKTLHNGLSFEYNGISVGADSYCKGKRAIAIGNESIAKGEADVAIGFQAMSSTLASGGWNVALGPYALNDITSGTHNVAIGHEAGSVGSGLYNTCIGAVSGVGIGNEDHCIAIGYRSLQSTGNYSIGVGVRTYAADYAVALGSGNKTASSPGAHATGLRSIAVGNESSAQGAFSIAIGNQTSATMGNTIAIGTLTQATAANVIAIGYRSGDGISTGEDNIAIGSSALGLNGIAGPTTGNKNIAIGRQALEGVTTGSYNIGIGYQAFSPGPGPLTSKGCITIGHQASGIQGTNYNIAIGYRSLFSGVKGCISIGRASGSPALDSEYNIAIGQGAAEGSIGGKNGFNTIIGAGACNNFGAGGWFAGERNVVLGGQISLTGNTGNCVVIGALASGTESCVVIGKSASVTGNNCIVIGPGSTTAGNGHMVIGTSCTSIGNTSSVYGAIAIGHNVISGNIDPYTPYSNTLGTVAVGNDVSATGRTAVAIGVGVVSTEDGSVAVGRYCYSKGEHASAFGIGARTDQKYGLAIGRCAHAVGTGEGSIAIGHAVNSAACYTVPTGDSTIGIGNGVSIPVGADKAICIGKDVTVTSANGIAIGEGSRTSSGGIGGINGIAIGRRSRAVGEGAIAIGSGYVGSPATPLSPHGGAFAYSYRAIAIGQDARSNYTGSTALNCTTDMNNVFGARARVGPVGQACAIRAIDGTPNSGDGFEFYWPTSSVQFKKDIRTLEDVGSKIDQARPVRYKSKLIDEGLTVDKDYIGFIAEELDDIFPEFVTYDSDGITPMGVDYPSITAVLMREIQSLRQRLSDAGIP